jgi:hypothetical protein
VPRLEDALSLASEGYRVVWVEPCGKKPLLSAWPDRATSDSAELARQYESLGVDDPNLGIALGYQPDGRYLVAIDVDDAHRYLALVAELGPLPETRSIRSARGEKHLFFVTLPATLRNVTGLAGAPGVDVKVAGGQIVAPPSIHPTGTPYEWSSLAPVAELPGAWLAAIRPVERPKPPPQLPPAPPTSNKLVRARAWLAARPGAVSGQGGHPHTFESSRKIVQDFGLSEGDAWALLCEWNQTCIPPWSERELRHKLDDALEARLSVPVVDRPRPASPPPALVSESPTPSGESWLDAYLTSSPEVWELPPPKQFLLRDSRTQHGALAQRGVCLLVAEGGAGKSFATVALGLAIATCTPWFGVLVPQRRGRVLFVSAEESAEELEHRRYYAAKHSGLLGQVPMGAIDTLDVHAGAFTFLDPRSFAVTDRGNALLELVSRRGPYDLIVIDPLARVSGASVDKDNAAAAALIGFFEQLSAAASALVFTPHHTDKIARREGIIDATAVRGATGLGDSARMVLVLASNKVDHGDPSTNERIGDIPVLHCTKANGVRRWDPIELRRTEDGTLVPLDAIDRAAVRDASHGRSREGRETAKRQEQEARLAGVHARQRIERAARKVAAEQAKREELEEDDRVARQLRADFPGLSHTSLRSKFVLLRAPCGDHRANDALRRTE